MIFFDNCVIILKFQKIKENALLAQLDRVTGYEPVVGGFESLTARHLKKPITKPKIGSVMGFSIFSVILSNKHENTLKYIEIH